MAHHSRASRLVLGAIVAVSLLGLGEVALRLARVQPSYTGDDITQWRMSPGLKDHRIRGHQEPHDFRLSTNVHGLRTPLKPDTAQQRERIAFLGDSNVFGWGVDDDQTLIAQAGAQLVAQGCSDVRLLNGGQPGYSSYMAATLFQEVIARYRPRMTVLFLSLHDFNRSLVSDRSRAEGPRTLSQRIRQGLLRHSRIHAALRRALYVSADADQLTPDEDDGEVRVLRVDDAERTRQLEKMKQIAASWGGEVTLGLLPFHIDLMQPKGKARTDAPGLGWAREWTARNRQPLIDLRACCGPDADALVFGYDKGHLNALGNAAVGKALADRLLQHSLASVRPDEGDVGTGRTRPVLGLSP